MYYKTYIKLKTLFWSLPKFRYLYWKLKHLIEPDWPQIYFNDGSLDDKRNRKFLIEYLHNLNSKKILEIGSASGVNLYMLESKKKNYFLHGIDISNYCISQGKKILRKLNSNIKLSCQNSKKLNFSDSFFDISFISGVVMDLDDETLKLTLNEAIRVSKKYVILHIQNYRLNDKFNTNGVGFVYKDHYLRDYHGFFKNNFNKLPIKIIKINSSFPDEPEDINFSELNYIIKIDLMV